MPRRLSVLGARSRGARVGRRSDGTKSAVISGVHDVKSCDESSKDDPPSPRLGRDLGPEKTDSAPGQLWRWLRRFWVAAIIPAAEPRKQFSGETSAHLVAIHIQLLIHR